MPAARRLQALFDQILDCNQASRSDCLRMFILSRELAEASNTLDSYPTVRFFVDWSLHSKLNRRSARTLLSQIAHIVESNRDSNPSALVAKISRPKSGIPPKCDKNRCSLSCAKCQFQAATGN